MSKLSEKLLANRHRRKREQIISQAAPALASILESAEVVTGIDVDTWVNEVPWPACGDGKLTTTQGDLDGSTLTTSASGDYKHIAHAFRAMPNPPSVDGYLWLESGPLFRISLGHYPCLMEHILEFSQARLYSEFAWVSDNVKHGFSLSTFCGFITEDGRTTYHKEVHYVLRWGI